MISIHISPVDYSQKWCNVEIELVQFVDKEAMFSIKFVAYQFAGLSNQIYLTLQYKLNEGKLHITT